MFLRVLGSVHKCRHGLGDGGGGQIICDHSIRALVIKIVTLWGGVSKIALKWVTSFIDDFFRSDSICTFFWTEKIERAKRRKNETKKKLRGDKSLGTTSMRERNYFLYFSEIEKKENFISSSCCCCCCCCSNFLLKTKFLKL